MEYTIINHHRNGTVDLKPIDRASAKRIITQKAYHVEVRGKYRDRHFHLDTPAHLAAKELRVRNPELADQAVAA